MFGMKRKKDIV